MNTPLGTVCSFYSYKGGVGRTLALASVATIAAQWGNRVLCVDWDLEAPGLHVYLRDHYRTVPPVRGVVDLMTSLSEGSTLYWRDLVVEVAPRGVSFDFLDAGVAQDSYLETLSALDWSHLYNDFALGAFLETMRDDWKLSYDLVLIDSRTGITDTAGICTAQLPDILVSLFTANWQSLDGSIETARLADEQRNMFALDKPRLRVLPILTRYEGTVEVELTRAWLGNIHDAVAPLVSTWLGRGSSVSDLITATRVPAVPYWSFGERIPPLEEDWDDPQTMSYAYAAIAALLLNDLDGSHVLLNNRSAYISSATRDVDPPVMPSTRVGTDVYLHYDQKEREIARELRSHLREQGISVTDAHEIEALNTDQSLSPSDTGRHLIALIGDVSQEEPLSPNFIYREFISAIADASTPRMIIPVLIGDAAIVPVQLSSFASVDGRRRSIAVLARQLADTLRGRAVVQGHNPSEVARLETWTADSLVRWQTVVSNAGLSDRFAHGYWSVSYVVDGVPSGLSYNQLRDALSSAAGRETGWPIGMTTGTEGAEPRIVNGAIEAFFGRRNSVFDDAAHSDYWRARQDGAFFLIRGYEDDGADSPHPAGTSLELVLPVWRLGEAVIHAARLATLLAGTEAHVHLKTVWRGLAGRAITSWGGSRRIAPSRRVASEQSVENDISFTVSQVEADLPTLVHELLRPVYEVFDFFELPLFVVEEELARLRSGSPI